MQSLNGISERRPRVWLLGALLYIVLWPCAILGQELSPRAYWPSPVGTKVFVAGYARSAGDVLMDPSVPLYGVDSTINTGFLAYMQNFSLWGRTTNVLLELPYSWGTTRGLVGDTPARRDFAGISDAGISMTMNLVGAPTMDREAFQALRADPGALLGFSIKLVPPTGRYQENRLINVGANRWAAKFELGSVIPLRPRWLLELEAGVWLLGDDDDFIVGKREQDPIYSAEVHIVRRFKPGFWASLDANYYTGGTQTIGGDEFVDQQDNRRFGGTLVVPFAGRHAVKVGYSVGTRTRYGNDFKQFLVTYQVLLH
jgi:hypothetical protein